MSESNVKSTKYELPINLDKQDEKLINDIHNYIVPALFFIVCAGVLIYNMRSLSKTEGFMNLWTKTNIDFDDIDMYYINLDRAHKRRADLEFQFKQQDLQVKRFPAVDARKLPNEAVAKVLQHPRSQNFLKSVLVDNRKNIGHFGCFLSHIGVYNEFMKSDKPYCLIFEDDAEFKTPTFKKDVNMHMGNVPDDWDIVLFGFHTADDLHYGKNQDTFLKDNIFYNLENWTGTHGYLINKRSCAKLLEKLMNPEWYLDWAMSGLVKQGHFKVYAVFEPLVCQPACYTLKFDNKHFFMHHILNCKWGGGMATTFSE
jgi:GR25 family glycosyltransferase involved in LPS biosynthesis